MRAEPRFLFYTKYTSHLVFCLSVPPAAPLGQWDPKRNRGGSEGRARARARARAEVIAEILGREAPLGPGKDEPA